MSGQRIALGVAEMVYLHNNRDSVFSEDTGSELGTTVGLTFLPEIVGEQRDGWCTTLYCSVSATHVTHDRREHTHVFFNKSGTR